MSAKTEVMVSHRPVGLLTFLSSVMVSTVTVCTIYSVGSSGARRV